MRKVSVYVLGGMHSAVFRYRFFQYLNNMNCDVTWNKNLSDAMYNRFMPISERNIVIKICMFLYILLRVLIQLISDFYNKPDVIIISRGLMKKWLPSFYLFLLAEMKKKNVKIIWDFDDDILAMKEIRRKDFDKIANLSDVIIIASPFLKNLLCNHNHEKVIILPTTDGELQNLYNNNIKDERIKHYDDTLKLLWIGTSSSLARMDTICPRLEKAAEILNMYNKRMELIIVCNRNVTYKSENFKITYRKWSQQTAIQSFLEAHIGLMPLKDSSIENGKGGFKLIQYLSVGLPALASSVGINTIILNNNNGGYLIKDLQSNEWEDNIIKIGLDVNLYSNLSDKARDNYLLNYNFFYNLKKWESIIG